MRCPAKDCNNIALDADGLCEECQAKLHAFIGPTPEGPDEYDRVSEEVLTEILEDVDPVEKRKTMDAFAAYMKDWLKTKLKPKPVKVCKHGEAGYCYVCDAIVK